MKKNKLVLIASIGKPRGLKGEFFLNSYSNPAENILNYSNFLKNDDISVNLKIEYIRRINKKFYSKILDINDVDEIKKYTNTKLFIDYKNLPELPQNETYLHDLMGMIVIDQNLDEILGVVDGLNNYGADDCIIVKPSINSIDKQERLIPFIKDKFIKSVDKKKRVIKVDWQKDF
ncbi:MAG: ribosome maturation factor RimM [Gammaproteobacteria bacterium]